MILLLQYTLIFASVLMLVALGGCFSEHAGAKIHRTLLHRTEYPNPFFVAI